MQRRTAERCDEKEPPAPAEAFGAVGVRVERPEELGPAIQEGLASDRLTVLHVPIAIGGPAD